MATVYSNKDKAKAAAKKAVTAHKGDKINEKGLVRESSETLKMIARWKCSLKHLDHFELDAEYRNKNGKWAQLGNGTSTVPTTSNAGGFYVYTFTAPSDATVTQVRYRVRAVAQTRKVKKTYYTGKKDKNGKKLTDTYEDDLAYWTATWSSYHAADAPALLDARTKAKTEAARAAAVALAAKNAKPAAVPGRPTVTLQANGSMRIQWTKPSESCVTRVYLCRCDDGLGTDKRKTLANVAVNTLEYIDGSVAAGHEYRYLLVNYNGNSKTWGPLGERSDPVQTKPLAPTGLTATAASDTEARLRWNDNGYRYCGETYVVEYSEHADAWSTGRTDIVTVANDLHRTGSSNTMLVADLEAGKTYYFRVALVGDGGTSALSSIAKVTLGITPEAPTPIPGAMGCELGQRIEMAWTHNCADGSAQSAAQISVSVNGAEASTITVGADSTYRYDTSSLSDGDIVTWRVRTRGAVATYSPWSATSQVTVYAKPTVGMELYAIADGGDQVGQGTSLPSLPLVVAVSVGDGMRQVPVLWSVELLAAEDFTYTELDGESAFARAGTVMCALYADPNDADFDAIRQVFTVSADEAAFCNGIPFYVRAMATMNSGLSSDWVQVEVVPEWQTGLPLPEAGVEIVDDYTATILPTCEDVREVPEGCGWLLEGERLTVEPAGITSGHLSVTYETDLTAETYEADVSFPLITELHAVAQVTQVSVDDVAYEGQVYESPNYVAEVTLAVYRIDAGGAIVLVQGGIANTGAVAVTDPHPRFGTGYYRVTANSAATDEVTVNDVECYAPFKTLLIQWDERQAEAAGEDTSVVALTYRSVELAMDLTVKESTAKDVTLNPYAGLSLPVADYGTQVGKKVSYSASFAAYSGSETVEALRELGEWMGPAYVRDRTGLGFWANVDVDVSHANSDGKVRVNLDVTPIEPPEEQ